MTQTKATTDNVHEVPTSVYDKTLRVIDHQTSPAQSPTVEPSTIRTVMCAHANFDPQLVEDALWIANEHDDILSVRDPEGRLRLCPANEETLRRLIGQENERDHPNVEIIEAAASLIESLQTEGDDE